MLEQARAALARGVCRVSPAEDAARLLPLCRNDAQLEAVIAAGLPEVELDWMELVGLQRAVERARAAGLRGDARDGARAEAGRGGLRPAPRRLRPDAVLVRHWGALVHFLERARGPAAPRAARRLLAQRHQLAHRAELLGLGLDTLTASHDLDAAQLFALLERAPAHRFTVVLHHHIATFHTEHCVYSHLLVQRARLPHLRPAVRAARSRAERPRWGWSTR